MSFEWRKDEEEGWEEQVPVSVVVERPSPPYRLYFAIFTVVAVVGGIVYGQVARRVTAATVALTAEVEASVALWQQAIVAEDKELFEGMLSRRDRGWAVTQQQLLVGEQFWGRQFWGWQWQETAVVTPTIALSPDLTEAEVVLPQPYVVRTSGGVIETVVLSQTAVFRLDEAGWLLTAPLNNFWGEEQSIERQNLLITFPARDRVMVLQLAEALEDGLKLMCFQATQQPCHPQLQVSLNFVTDPMSIYDGRLPREYPQMGDINLPSPTLFGLPQDEAGLQLLRQNYLARLIPPVLPTVLGWQEERQIFFDGIVSQFLVEWGLRSSFLTPNHYELLLKPPVTLQEISLIWASADFAQMASIEHVEALIAFLVARGETAVSLQRRITTPNFWQWANLPPNDPASEQAWLQFLYDHSASALQPSPIPLPDLDMRLVCGSNLYRYNGVVWWDEMLPYEAQSLVEAVPHDDGLLVAGRYFEEAAKDFRGRAFWVRGEQSIQFSEWRTNTDAPLVSAQQHDPAGRKLVLQENDPVDRNLVRYRLLDLDSCTGQSCPLLFLPGWPVWSVDGRSTLIMPTKPTNPFAPQPVQIWLGDADGQIRKELGLGYAPFWLDEQTVGYVRLGSNGRGEVVTADIYDGDGTPEAVLLTIDELFGHLPGPGNPPPAFMADVQVNPVNNRSLLVTVVTSDLDKTFLFGVEQQADQSNRVRRLLEGSGRVESGYSPDGRLMLIDTASLETGLHTVWIATFFDIVVDDLYIREMSNAAVYDWTADSQWLLINQPNFLRLVAPGQNYQQLIPHSFGSCERVEWVQ